MVEITQYALKGQKLLAQGIALGIIAVSKTPCLLSASLLCLILLTCPSTLSTFIVPTSCVLTIRKISYHLTFSCFFNFIRYLVTQTTQ